MVRKEAALFLLTQIWNCVNTKRAVSFLTVCSYRSSTLVLIHLVWIPINLWNVAKINWKQPLFESGFYHFISIVGYFSYELEFSNIFALSQRLRQPTSTNALPSISSLNSVFTSAQRCILTNSSLDPTGITFDFCARTLEMTANQAPQYLQTPLGVVHKP